MKAQRRFRSRALGGVLAFSLVVIACGGDDEGSEPRSTTGEISATTQPEQSTAQTDTEQERSTTVDYDPSAEFRFAMNFGGQSFDPHRAANPAAWAMFMRPVYDSLLTLEVTPDGDFEIAPQLATEYHFSDDGLTLSMELRDDVVFHDGTPFNADAVKANIERAKDEQSSVASLLAAVEDVEVLSETHVQFNLNTVSPALPYSFAGDTIGMMISPQAFDNDDLELNPVGSGPFQLVEFEPDSTIVYERWDDHWDADAAWVSKLTIDTVADANARYNGVRTGVYDAGYMSPPADVASRELVDEGYHWVLTLAPFSAGLLMNSTVPPFDDVRVRRAVTLAVDREAIARDLLDGITEPMYQPFARGYLGFDPDLDVNPYDPEAAAALIEEAGAVGEKVTLLAITSPPYPSVAAIIQQSLGDIGLDVEIEQLAATEGIPTWQEGRSALYTASLFAEPEPSLTLQQAYLGGMAIGEPPADLVEMAAEAIALPVGSEERERAYQEISAYLVENPIHMPLTQFATVILARPDVVGAENLVPVVIGKLDFRRVGISE